MRERGEALSPVAHRLHPGIEIARLRLGMTAEPEGLWWHAATVYAATFRPSSRANRSDNATMVSVGFATPLVGKTDAPAT